MKLFELTNKEWITFLGDFSAIIHTLPKDAKLTRVPYDIWKELTAQRGKMFVDARSEGMVIFKNEEKILCIDKVSSNSIGKYWHEYYPTHLFESEMSTSTICNYSDSASSVTCNTADYYSTGTVTNRINIFGGSINPIEYGEPKNKVGVKENKTMENKIINFDFGPANGDIYRMSMYGLAVKNRDGNYVAWDNTNEEMMNVDIINFKVDNMIYKMPVALKDVATGMIILHNKMPMFVVSVELENKYLDVVDIYSGERKMILPTKSPFGFNFYTRVMPLIDFSTLGGDTSPSESNPFGNMLPLLLLGDSSSVDPVVLALMFSGQVGASPMMMYALMASKDGKNNNLLPLMLMMNGGNFMGTNSK